MPWRCSSSASVSPAGPAPTMPTWVLMARHHLRPRASSRPTGVLPRVSDPDTPTSYLREPPGTHPDLDCPEYRSSGLRHPTQPLLYLPQDVTEITGPQLGPSASATATRTSPASTPASRSASASSSAGRLIDSGGRPLPAPLVEIWQANAAGRYGHRAITGTRRWTPTSRGRALPHRGGRELSLRDRTARRLPVEEPPQRLAAGAHPFLPLRPGVRAASRDPDVLPRDPLSPSTPSSTRSATGGARPDGGPFDLSRPSRSGPRLRLRRRAAWAGRHPLRGRAVIFPPTPSQTVGPFFSIGLEWVRAGELVGPRPARARWPRAVGCSTEHGAPVPDRVIEIWQADPTGRFADLQATAGLPAGRLPRLRAVPHRARRRRVLASHGQAGPRRRTAAGRRRRTSTCRCSRGAAAPLRDAVYFADEAPANGAIRCSGSVPAERRAHAAGRAGGGRLPLRHPPAGGRGAVLLCLLKTPVRRRLRARRRGHRGVERGLAAGDARHRGGARPGPKTAPGPSRGRRAITAVCRADEFDDGGHRGGERGQAATR